MDIPDEAAGLSKEQQASVVREFFPGGAAFIARAAQVAVLRETHDYIANFYDEYKGEQPLLEWISRKADELEGGG